MEINDHFSQCKPSLAPSASPTSVPTAEPTFPAFTAKLGAMNGVGAYTYSFKKAVASATQLEANNYRTAMIETCRKYGMKPVCDHPTYCKPGASYADQEALYIGQSSHIVDKRFRQDPNKMPTGFGKIESWWTGLCSYSGLDMSIPESVYPGPYVGKNAKCDIGQHPLWMTIQDSKNPGFMCGVIVTPSPSKSPTISPRFNIAAKGLSGQYIFQQFDTACPFGTAITTELMCHAAQKALGGVAQTWSLGTLDKTYGSADLPPWTYGLAGVPTGCFYDPNPKSNTLFFNTNVNGGANRIMMRNICFGAPGDNYMFQELDTPCPVGTSITTETVCHAAQRTFWPSSSSPNVANENHNKGCFVGEVAGVANTLVFNTRTDGKEQRSTMRNMCFGDHYMFQELDTPCPVGTSITTETVCHAALRTFWPLSSSPNVANEHQSKGCFVGNNYVNEWDAGVENTLHFNTKTDGHEQRSMVRNMCYGTPSKYIFAALDTECPPGTVIKTRAVCHAARQALGVDRDTSQWTVYNPNGPDLNEAGSPKGCFFSASSANKDKSPSNSQIPLLGSLRFNIAASGLTKKSTMRNICAIDQGTA